MPNQCVVSLIEARPLHAFVPIRPRSGEAHLGGEFKYRRGLHVKTFINMIRDDSGASAAEYALLLALVGVGIALAAFNLGGAVKAEITCAAQIISATGTPPSC